MKTRENFRPQLYPPPPSPQEVLNVALVDEKGVSNYLKMTSSCKSFYPVNKTFVKMLKKINHRRTINEFQLYLTVSTRSCLFFIQFTD